GSVKPSGEAHSLWEANVQRRSTLAPAILSPLALTGAAQLGDGHGLVELSHSAEHLAHEGRRRRVIHKGPGAISSNDLDTLLSQHAMPCLLHDEIARETIGCFNDDRAGPVAGDVLEHGGKAWACIYLVRASQGLVVVFALELVADTLGEGLDCCP